MELTGREISSSRCLGSEKKEKEATGRCQESTIQTQRKQESKIHRYTMNKR